MDKVSGRLTVFFEEPVWVGVFERISDGKYLCVRLRLAQNQRIMKYTISFMKNYYRLRFSLAVVADVKEAVVILNGYSEKQRNSGSLN